MENSFRVSKIKREAFFNMKNAHLHEQHEIYYLISGERNITINDHIKTIGKGDLVIIPAGNMHRTTYSSSNAHERVAMVFDDSMLTNLYGLLGKECIEKMMNNFFVRIPDGRRGYVEDLLNRIIYETEIIDEYSIPLRDALFNELFLFLLRCHKNGADYEKVDVANELIQKAATYIFENYDKNIGLNDVASHFGMSSSYFSKKFKLITGFGFKEYLTGVRIKAASDLLMKSNRSITDIAIMCGFNDSNYFGDAFRKIKGVSPNKYRKNKGVI